MTQDVRSDSISATSADGAGPAPRAPWTSPRVIVSDLGGAQSTVSNGADGHTTTGTVVYQYGS